jgi:hypothetical protein
MDQAFPVHTPGVAPPSDVLRQWLCAAQRGDAACYESLLRWVAWHGRAKGTPEAELQRALILLNHLRHTYDPRHCPLRWVDAILHHAAGSRAARS